LCLFYDFLKSNKENFIKHFLRAFFHRIFYEME
jgi:hypothetical protein